MEVISYLLSLLGVISVLGMVLGGILFIPGIILFIIGKSKKPPEDGTQLIKIGKILALPLIIAIILLMLSLIGWVAVNTLSQIN